MLSPPSRLSEADDPTKRCRAHEDLVLKCLIQSGRDPGVEPEQDMCFTYWEGADQITFVCIGKAYRSTLDDPHPVKWVQYDRLGHFPVPPKNEWLLQQNPIHLRGWPKSSSIRGRTFATQHRVNDAITATFCTTEMFFNVETKCGLPESDNFHREWRLGCQIAEQPQLKDQLVQQFALPSQDGQYHTEAAGDASSEYTHTPDQASPTT